VRIFVAGATGAIGRRLTPLLIAAGHTVSGTTRSADRARELKRNGVQPVVVDVFNKHALRDAVARVQPDVVIHQLTDLPQVFDPAHLAEMLQQNSRIRIEGTPNLIDAAQEAKVRRFIAQSIAFAYADGPEPHSEDDPIGPLEGGEPRAITARGVHALEQAVLNAYGMEGIVLRYGRLYGPGTWAASPNGRAPLHVDAAANAALLAVKRGAPGIYNIAEDDGAVTTDKARRELGFDPAFRSRR